MMRLRKTATVALASLVLIAALVGSLFGFMHFKEHQRINDADPAFSPLLHLGCRVWDQPIGFHRYCRYVVEFPADCELADTNAAKLESLNRLPSKNTLDVTIHTRKLTDESLEHLSVIGTFDLLDVTDTSISDTGIAELRRRLPDTIIPTRESE